METTKKTHVVGIKNAGRLLRILELPLLVQRVPVWMRWKSIWLMATSFINFCRRSRTIELMSMAVRSTIAAALPRK